MTIPHLKYGHSLPQHFRYLTCLLDRGHIIIGLPGILLINILLQLGWKVTSAKLCSIMWL